LGSNTILKKKKTRKTKKHNITKQKHNKKNATPAQTVTSKGQCMCGSTENKESKRRKENKEMGPPT
jgi:hypothetical protein